MLNSVRSLGTQQSTVSIVSAHITLSTLVSQLSAVSSQQSVLNSQLSVVSVKVVNTAKYWDTQQKETQQGRNSQQKSTLGDEKTLKVCYEDLGSPQKRTFLDRPLENFVHVLKSQISISSYLESAQQCWAAATLWPFEKTPLLNRLQFWIVK